VSFLAGVWGDERKEGTTPPLLGHHNRAITHCGGKIPEFEGGLEKRGNLTNVEEEKEFIRDSRGKANPTAGEKTTPKE